MSDGSVAAWTSIGDNGSSAPGTRPKTPNDAIGPSTRRTPPWPGPWGSGGGGRWGPDGRAAGSTDGYCPNQRPRLSQEERERIAALSSDLPALWHAPGTTHRDRKEIIRHLVEKVVVHGKTENEYVDVTIHWRGGCLSRHEILRPVRSYEQLR